MGGRRSFFLVILLAVVMVALPILYTGSSVGSDQDTILPDTQTTAGPSGYASWSFAVLTDLHVGRGIGDYDGPGYNDSGTPVSGTAAVYAQNAVNEINKLAGSQNIASVVVLGDMTDSAEGSELRAAKQILDNLAVPWIPIMGNRDAQPMTDNEQAPLCCPPAESQFDTIMGPEYSNLAAEMSGWGKESPALVYDPEGARDTYFENFFFDHGGFHSVCLDFNNRLGDRAAGDLQDFAGGTWSWFKQHMEQFVQQNPERSQDVILLAHHPLLEDDGGGMTFTTTSLADVRAPWVASVASTITDAGATITWTTDEATTSRVEYGLTAAYGSSKTTESLVTSRSVALTGLEDGKAYHYRVISKDAANNQALSADMTFTTAAASGGMPAWAWGLIWVSAVLAVCAAAYPVAKRATGR